MADLEVPVLIQATPDTPGKMSIADRRDSFCGKMSACNNLKQYGIPYSLTTLHTKLPIRTRSRRTSPGSPPCAASFGLAQAARRRHRRASGGLQHRALQREAARGQRHLRRDRSTFPRSSAGSKRLTGPEGARRSSRPSEVRRHANRCRRGALMKMAKLGVVIDDWMQDERPPCQRRPVLDLDRGVSSAWCPAPS